MSCCSVVKRLSCLLLLGAFAVPSTIASAEEDTAKAPSEADDAAESTSDEAPEFIYARMETSKGPVLLELNNAKAPISTANFVEYAEAGTYDGTIFHRVIPNFMIQGGGFDSDLKQRETRDPIKNEWQNGLSNTRGTVAMARTNDPDSATCQFFVNVKDNLFLDQGRTPAPPATRSSVVSSMG